ncbi:hypothetical protein Tco_1458968 [Tanacetum coccineum]
MAMIVNSGTTIDPVTGREVKGKERMEDSMKWWSCIWAEITPRAVIPKEDDNASKEQSHSSPLYIDDILWLTSMKKTKDKERIKGILWKFLNYARNHIPKLGILLRPLYEKTNAHGDKRLKPSDYELVRKIKGQVQNLPDLEIPPENAYIILETDGCMEGWGGIVKWKKSKEDPRSSERICAYASGKFSTTQSTIDAEINSYNNTLEKLKIYYLDKQKMQSQGTAFNFNIEHIEGKHNTLADSLSRPVNLCFAECTGEMKELAIASLYSVKEVLQSPNAFKKNMNTTCEEVMKISNHLLEFFT